MRPCSISNNGNLERSRSNPQRCASLDCPALPKPSGPSETSHMSVPQRPCKDSMRTANNSERLLPRNTHLIFAEHWPDRCSPHWLPDGDMMEGRLYSGHSLESVICLGWQRLMPLAPATSHLFAQTTNRLRLECTECMSAQVTDLSAAEWKKISTVSYTVYTVVSMDISDVHHIQKVLGKYISVFFCLFRDDYSVYHVWKRAYSTSCQSVCRSNRMRRSTLEACLSYQHWLQKLLKLCSRTEECNSLIASNFESKMKHCMHILRGLGQTKHSCDSCKQHFFHHCGINEELMNRRRAVMSICQQFKEDPETVLQCLTV